MPNHATVSRSAQKAEGKLQEAPLLGAAEPESVAQRAAISSILHGSSAADEVIERAESPIVQPKLTVGPEGDRYEQEADRVAAQIVDDLAAVEDEGGAPGLTATGTSATTKPNIQRTPAGIGGTTVAPSVQTNIERARGGGQSLPASARPSLEQAFGADFGGVRIHTDGESHRLSRELNARAFTTGQDIFFKAGAYTPGTPGGRHLLAHELTHVVQQAGNQVRPRSEVKPGAAASSEPKTLSASDAVTARGAVPANMIQRTIDRPGWVRSAKEPTKIAKAILRGRKSYGYEQYYLESPSGEDLGAWSADTKNWVQALDLEQENNRQQREESSYPEKHEKEASRWRNSKERKNVNEGKQRQKWSEDELGGPDFRLPQYKEGRQGQEEQDTDKPLSPIGTAKEKEEVRQEKSKLTERQQDALKLIENYRAENTRLKNAFRASHPVAEAYLSHLKTRIEEPKEIDQSETGLCGVMAFMYSIARDDPVAYAQYALTLFEEGKASIGKLEVQATNRIISKATNLREKFGMSLVDYVTCASLRMSENKKPFQHNPANLKTGFFTAVTMPEELPKWFELAGYQTKETARKPNVSASIYDFNAAVVHLKQGHIVCLAVGWNLYSRGGDLYNKILGGVVGPDHWVVLTGVKEDKDGDSTIIDLYSHGKIVSIILKKELSKHEAKEQSHKGPRKLISWETFLKHYYGYVAAWKPAK